MTISLAFHHAITYDLGMKNGGTMGATGTKDQKVSDLRAQLAESLAKSKASVEPSMQFDWSLANKEKHRTWVVNQRMAVRYRADLRRQIKRAVKS